MSLPWLDQPVMLHSSRDAGTCSLTPEQCAFKTQYWVFWYEADHRYGLPTTAFFLAAIIVVAIGHLTSVYAPSRVRQHPLWLRLQSSFRFLSYKTWRLGSWNTQSVAAYLMAAAGAVFFLAMTLGPHPYYWPNTRKLSFGNSPPIATRAGFMALACMPFLFLLGAKANPISTLTGISHEKLNVWHNWVAWAMFVLALVHTFPFIIFHIWKGDIVKQWNTGGIWVTGVIAIIAQAWLTFMSVRWIRNRYYELFKATHFFAAAVFFIFFLIHCDFRLTSWDYFIATGVLYGLSWFYSQSRTYLEHGLRHAQLSMVSPHTLKVVIETNTKWTPGQHVYLRFLTCGMHALTAHPFTISSVPQHGRPSKMVFYIEPRGGITARLAKLAEKSPGASVPVLLDGPYGGVTSRWFQAFDRTLIVVGGAGAGFSLPLIEDFLQLRAQKKPGAELEVVVATRDSGFRAWYYEALNDIVARQDMGQDAKTAPVSIQIHETASSGQQRVLSSATGSLDEENGKEIKQQSTTILPEGPSPSPEVFNLGTFTERPNIPSLAKSMTEKAGSVGLVVCGPSSMVFDVKQSAAAAQQKAGKGNASDDVWLYNESFSF